MGIMPGGAHYAQTLGVPPLPLLLLGLMVALGAPAQLSWRASRRSGAATSSPPTLCPALRGRSGKWSSSFSSTPSMSSTALG